MDTVSIIIPIYNSARYLPACLDSALAQTYPGLDIVLVEDGSTDDSLELCTTYALRDNRVNLISGDHRGVSAARNVGLHAATGRYVLFVDSDDICEPDLVSRLMEAGADKPKTLTLCGILVVDESNHPTGVYQEEALSCDIQTYISRILAKWQTNPLCGGVYCKLFDLQALKEAHITFEENETYAEDFNFNMAYLRRMEHVTILPDPLYRYRCGRSGSLTEKNLNEVEFSSLWQRRLAVTNTYEETFAFFGLKEEHTSDISAFSGFHLADMIQLAARRAGNYNSFRQSMAVLREGQKEREIPTGISPKDQKSIQLLYANKLYPLWLYESFRRRLRILRGHQR